MFGIELLSFVVFSGNRLFRTFSLWLEEPRLHEPSLFLPALPPQYNSSKLAALLQGNTVWVNDTSDLYLFLSILWNPNFNIITRSFFSFRGAFIWLHPHHFTVTSVALKVYYSLVYSVIVPQGNFKCELLCTIKNVCFNKNIKYHILP